MTNEYVLMYAAIAYMFVLIGHSLMLNFTGKVFKERTKYQKFVTIIGTIIILIKFFQ